MKNNYKYIIIYIAIIFLISCVSVTASVLTDAEKITFQSNLTSKENVQESLNELYENLEKCPDGQVCYQTPTDLTSTKKCRRAAYLHVETYYRGTGARSYGNEKYIEGELTAGDAFTCDVNGDGIYDEETERFYYVSDLFVTHYPYPNITYDSNYAVLIYYSNTIISGGVVTQNNSQAVKYYSSGDATKGPQAALANIPSTSQWSNVRLKSQSKDIESTNGTKVSFTYSGKAARLVNYYEVLSACGEMYGADASNPKCDFMSENTSYNVFSNNNGYWFENEYNSVCAYIWQNYRVYYERVDYANYYGVRPVIEVLKTDMSY